MGLLDPPSLPKSSPAFTGTPTINGKAAKAQRFHNTPVPLGSLGQYSSARIVCGVDAANGKLWSYNSTGLYQVDALTSTAWSSIALPANCTVSGQAAKIVVWTPPAGVATMYGLFWNSTASRWQVYSSPVAAKTVTPTWSGPLLSYAANGIIIPTAFRATSVGVFAGEYTGTPDITGGPSVYRSTDGTNFTTVLGPLSTTRHVHSIYEDPYNLGTIYVALGDFVSPYTPPYALYRSTNSGASFTGITTLTASTWQLVSMGFTADYVWCVSDHPQGDGPFLLDRATFTPRWGATKGRHDGVAVPGATGGRYVTDLAITSGSATVTSATAAFSSATDLGRRILGPNGVIMGSYISAVTNSTTATISVAATSTGTVTARIDSDTFYGIAYCGAVDPASGWLYVAANDASNSGNVSGLFVLTGPDEPWRLLYTMPLATIGNHEMFIAGGYLWVDRYGPWPVLTAV